MTVLETVYIYKALTYNLGIVSQTIDREKESSGSAPFDTAFIQPHCHDSDLRWCSIS
jgi:hypothetical protein